MLERYLERHCLGDRMGSIADIQLMQDLLNMVFNGEGTDVEQMCDFIITFAHLNVTQNFCLTIRDQFPRLSSDGTMLVPLMEQHAYQRHMHVGHKQFQKICMTLGQCNGHLRKREQASRPAIGVEHAVRRHTLQIISLEIICKLPVCDAAGVMRAKQNRPVLSCVPCGHDTKYNTAIRPAKFGKRDFAYIGTAKSVNADRLSGALVEQAYQQPMWQKALNFPLRP